jgi:aspartate kinase
MALIVHKYGGTSMGSTERIKNVAKRVAKWHRAGHRVVVVPSAMSGETNRLLGLAKEISAQPDPRELDMLASTGEQASVALLAIALHGEGIDAVSYTGWQVPVKTDSSYTKARIESIDDERILGDLDAGKVVVITGFQGIDGDGNITTLGRGGSDTSAVAIAAAIEADECLIYTDVDGVYDRSARGRRRPPPGPDHLRGNAGNGQPGFQGAADPLGGVRRQVSREDARAVVADRPPDAARTGNAFGHADYF